mmetsp:Transcript_114407/g.363616  ORF Transcript_114407/g.363616 Transcript_114407/m.363616 type:complete len:258 (-) Transcript_114407:196-969(-)
MAAAVAARGARRQRASLNLSDLPELLPGARPSANPAHREEFETRCRKLYEDEGSDRRAQRSVASVATASLCRELELMFPDLDAALIFEVCGDAVSVQSAIEILLVLSAAADTTTPAAATGAPGRQRAELGVEDHEKFPTLFHAEATEGIPGGAWCDRARAAAGLPAPPPRADRRAQCGAVQRRGPEQRPRESEGSHEDNDESVLGLTDHEARHLDGQRRAERRMRFGRGGGQGRGPNERQEVDSEGGVPEKADIVEA